MKKIKNTQSDSHWKGRFFSVVMAFFIIFSLASCAKKVVFPVSYVVPAAEGSVKVKTDKNENYAIDLNVKNLASPERLQPPKEVYIVWMETQSETMSLGQIGISNKLKGSLETVTHQEPIRIFITAEDSPNVQYPGMQVILKTETFEMK